MQDVIELIPVTVDDAKLLHKLQIEAFMPLYEKYHDDATSPVKEPLEKIICKITEQNSEFYFIRFHGENVGGIRIRHYEGEKVLKNVSWISPIFIIPPFQNKGIAGKIIQKMFELYPETIVWRLETIKQEGGNCHLYEKCGFGRVGSERAINERMTLISYEKSCVTSHRFKDYDAKEVSNLIIRNFLEVNSKDYGLSAMQELAKQYTVEKVLQTASYAHMYVFRWKNQIVGVGSISSFWGSETESILLTIFALPEFHGMGIGRVIMNTLEKDELFMRASRVEIPASITAIGFYRKFGYDYKNGTKELDEEGHYRLEKFKEADIRCCKESRHERAASFSRKR